MLFSLLYFLVCRLLGPGGRRAEERDIELLVLRHHPPRGAECPVRRRGRRPAILVDQAAEHVPSFDQRWGRPRNLGWSDAGRRVTASTPRRAS
jgi:hypothetical protein